MTDFINKKEKLTELLMQYVLDKSNTQELLEYAKELEQDDEFKNNDLFKSLFKDLQTCLNDLTNKEIKQRALMIKTYMP